MTMLMLGFRCSMGVFLELDLELGSEVCFICFAVIVIFVILVFSATFSSFSQPPISPLPTNSKLSAKERTTR